MKKLFAIQAQLGTQAIDALIHPILRPLPELIQHLLHPIIVRRDRQALAQHKACRHLNDRKGQRIRVIRLVALVMDLKVGRRNDILDKGAVAEPPPQIVLLAPRSQLAPVRIFLRRRT